VGTIFDRDYEPPEPGPGDAAHALAHGIVDLVPVAADLLSFIIGPPLERRRQEWMQDIADAVRRLEKDRGIRPDQLQGNPAFIDAVLSATDAAIRTSQEGKRRALRNAVMNAALPTAPEIPVQQMFIALVNRFTEWHVRILKLFAAPEQWSDASGRHLRDTNSLAALIEQAYPELQGRTEVYNQVWADLGAAGLHQSGGLQVMMTSAMGKRTSRLGDAFLAFIEEPPTG
jgi:hypothetical protein